MITQGVTQGVTPGGYSTSKHSHCAFCKNLEHLTLNNFRTKTCLYILLMAYAFFGACFTFFSSSLSLDLLQVIDLVNDLIQVCALHILHPLQPTMPNNSTNSLLSALSPSSMVGTQSLVSKKTLMFLLVW